jgi:gluconokinase
MARLKRHAEPLVLALDVGTSSVRAILHDARGDPIGEGAHEAYRPAVGRDGKAELSPTRLVGLTEQVIDRALEGCRSDVSAVGVSTFWHGLLGLRGGRPATPLWLWSDSRSWPRAEALRRRPDAEQLRQRTGCPLHPSYWPAKLLWARAEGFGADTWCSLGDLLQHRLTGELVTSLSMASGTGLLRLRAAEWDAEMLEIAGVRSRQLPVIDDQPRPLSTRHRRRWPQLAAACWVPAAGDGALANLGSGCVDPSRRALTVGTSGALRVTTAAAPERIPDGLWTYRLDRDRFITGGSFSNGGNFHAWALATLKLDAKDFDALLGRGRPAAHGLVVLPLLAGERSPGFAIHATGAVAGITLATTATDIARAGMEAIAIDFARVDALLDGAAPGAQRLVGSGAALLHNPGWMRIFADAIGKPLVRGRAAEASSRGAAILALERLGVPVHHSRATAGRTFTPDPAAHAAYRAQRERQEALYDALIRRSSGSKGSNGG